MLDKSYNSDNHLIIKLELKNMRTEIIKIGKDLNFLWGKNISSMFPTQFIHIAKKHLYYDYETQVQNIGGQIRVHLQLFKIHYYNFRNRDSFYDKITIKTSFFIFN